MTTHQLTSYGLRNYKSFSEQTRIEIPGITILLGPNSSGKSNILESLLLLKQTFESDDINLKLNGEQVKLGEYSDVVNERDETKNIQFKFYFERDSLDLDEDQEYQCPVCGKGYIIEGFYTNHLEDKHPKFWEEYGPGRTEEIREFEDALEHESFVSLTYAFNTQTKLVLLDEIEFGYPSPSEGLLLSSLKLKNFDRRFELIAEDLFNREIIRLQLEKTAVIEELPSQFEGQKGHFDIFRGLRDIVKVIAIICHLHRVSKSGSYYGWPYSLRMHRIGDNDLFPAIYRHTGIIQDNLERLYRLDPGEDFDHTDEVLLTGGLISRLSDIAMQEEDPLSIIESFFEKLNHVGPLRRDPQRIYYGSGGSPAGLQSTGETMEETIFRAEQMGQRDLLKNINKWLDETGFGVEIDIDPVGVGDLYQVKVLEEGFQVNLADSGFGLSQTLPIIVQSIRMVLQESSEDAARVPRWFPFLSMSDHEITPMSIEQPEIHLNPRIESALGDFFIHLMENDILLLIETHSEHLLNRIQRRIAEGKFESPEKLAVYFISKPELASKLDRIQIEETGRIANWPDGFFQDDIQDTWEILRHSIPEE